MQALREEMRGAGVPPAWRPKVEWATELYLRTIDSDLGHHDTIAGAAERALFRHGMARDHLTELWYVAASDTPDGIKPRVQAKLAAARIQLSGLARQGLRRLRG